MLKVSRVQMVCVPEDDERLCPLAPVKWDLLLEKMPQLGLLGIVQNIVDRRLTWQHTARRDIRLPEKSHHRL